MYDFLGKEQFTLHLSSHTRIMSYISHILLNTAATTVGYGDYSPKTQYGRLLAIFFIPLSVGAMGHFLSSVATVIMDSRRSSFQKQMDTHELSLQDLEIMDYDGDGLVTRAEYLEFMLVGFYNTCHLGLQY